jgi:signal transduction histidine kinase
MLYFILFLFNLVLVEAITNLLVKSDLFSPIRKHLFESSNMVLKFISRILDCPYCTSVWSAFFCVGVTYLFVINVLPVLIVLFFLSIILHRFSNIIHHIIDRIDPNHGDGQGN